MIRAIAILLLCVSPLLAEYRTTNFVVRGGSVEWEKAVGDAAETFRRELSEFWFSKQLPDWPSPCSIQIVFAKTNGGCTTFAFDNGTAFGFDMTLRATPERIIDSVLRHEVNHTVFATHFRQPVPRWADEGMCSLLEHEAERMNWEESIERILKSRRGIPIDQLFSALEYPRDYEAFYAQGYSICSWLIETHGPQKLIDFVTDGVRDRDWSRAIRDTYGFETPLDMQNAWLAWMRETPGPVRFHAGQCGSCQSGFSFGGRCSNGDCQQQPNRIVRPPQMVPIQPAPQPAPPRPAAVDWSAKFERQESTIAELQLKLEATIKTLGEIKGCRCDDCLAKCDAKIAAAIASIKIPQPKPPEPLNYDALAAEMQQRLTHSATVVLLDGTVKPQTRPLSKPLEFNQHVRPKH